MRNIFFAFFLFLTLPAFAQRESDFGVMAGGAYYMGDINTSMPFYSPSISAGFNYRYNFNPRYVLKAEINYLVLKASDRDFSDPYQQFRNASFSAELYDLSAHFEFNFLPLKYVERKISFSPFISAGIGGMITLNSSSEKSVGLVLPASIGIRLTIGKKWSTGIEWNVRSTFKDGFDNIKNPIPSSINSPLINNDWYSFAGLFLTYKIFDFGLSCPAYGINNDR